MRVHKLRRRRSIPSRFKLHLATSLAWLAATTGCVPDAFERDADRQVNALVRNREQSVLGYTPNAAIGHTPLTNPPRKPYASVPLTELPSLGAEPIMLRKVKRQATPLGPVDDADALAATTLPTNEGVEQAGRYTTEGFRLGPPAELSRVNRFGLFDCLHYAVNNSRQYQDRIETLYGSALNVTLQRHLFEPRAFGNVSARYNGGQASSNYRSALTVAGQLGVRQRLPLGGEVVASGLVSIIDALNEQTADGESARVALTASIPFLRGAGLVNLEPLISSERNLIYAVRDFETYRRNFAIQISGQYFQLIRSQLALRNRYLRYLDSLELQARAEAFFMSGTQNALEVERASQEVLTNADEVNRAVESYDNALDDFKVLIGMPLSEELAVVPIALDVAEIDLDIDRMTSIAMRYRLDLQTARDRVDDSRRQVEVAKNQLLPDLTLDIDTGFGNPGDTRARQLNTDTLNYTVDLNLDLPLDRLSERNRYRQALLNFQGSQRDVVDLEQGIQADVRQAVRSIRAAQTTLELQRQGIDTARRRLEYANALLMLGRAPDTRNVVEAQSSLLQAQDRFEQARADLQVQVLVNLRDTGQLRLDDSSGTLGMAMKREGADQIRE